jgi:streptogramin lyase
MNLSHLLNPDAAQRSCFTHWPGGRRGRCLSRAVTILAIVGSVLGRWAQPVAAAPTITEFHVSNGGVPQGIAAGPDGNLWFTEFYDNQVGRITTSGVSKLFTLNAVNSATYITNGPSGDLWLTLLNDVGGSTTNQIGRLTSQCKLTTFAVPKSSHIWDITEGTDGNLYFTEGASRVWRLTPTGHFTAFPSTDSTGAYPYQITAGPDGNLWFTDRAHQVVKMTPSGQFTAFTLPLSIGTPDDIATGPDGNLWFTLDDASASNRIGRITPSGVITHFSVPGTSSYIYMTGRTRSDRCGVTTEENGVEDSGFIAASPPADWCGRSAIRQTRPIRQGYFLPTPISTSHGES